MPQLPVRQCVGWGELANPSVVAASKLNVLGFPRIKSEGTPAYALQLNRLSAGGASVVM